MTHTARTYVIRSAQLKGLDLFKPNKADKGILAYAKNPTNPNVLGKCVIDAQNWAEAKAQINAYYAAEANR